ncbi:hypothetical protein FQR65_LT15200 [Abscondita terminalis]|nr:hypothetical protein FQR65_LT15200 [Abscondita terminalis]
MAAGEAIYTQRGTSQLWTLLHLKYRKHIIASNGDPGGSALRSGANGKDEILEVPLGTIARDAETGEVLFDITEDGETKILTAGGIGGLGNWHFKSATQADCHDCLNRGDPNRANEIILELKCQLPKPEIANLPFTTLVPNLGIVSYRDNKSFVMADIPGIIEGASEGKGLGYRFLRHIERNSVLLFMVPADTDRTIAEEYHILLKELTAYNPELMDKPKLLRL